MQSTDQPLAGKILLITGGASGIGLSLTKQAHSIGARVLVADLRTTPDYDTFAADKDSILFVQSDVTLWPAFSKIFTECQNKWNDIPDAYAICAGVFEPPFSNFWDDPEQDEGYAQVDINVNHPIKLTRLALRQSLAKGKRASVCIIASIAGIASNIAAPLYSATKHAIVGFVKAMKHTEPLTGVRITALCPGAVMTPLFDAQKITQFSVAQDRFLTPDACAEQMLELLQSKEYACGTVLEITLGGTRVIPEWGVEPPQGKGAGEDLMHEEEFKRRMMAPIEEAIRKDKVGERV